ncbi:metallophosphoesterase [Sporomusa sp.]|uniref:metallophosphoesterase n=1 Tax=Sporomusa sp. TaxID=2078658 RepID=UPI002C047D0A|nr:metallophosphoesterase [Sporomusa sp.]HWR05966.1 metallophosphoesterase [Sporomusa sp.]
MSSFFIGMLSLFFLVYSAASYYVGLRILQSFYEGLEAYTVFYWGCYVLMAITPFAARIGRTYFPGVLNDWITVIGNYWLAALYYLVLIWLFIDLARLSGRLFLSAAAVDRVPAAGVGIGVMVMVGCLLVYGVWNARNPRVHHYDVTIKKPVAGLAGLRAVMVSDIHLGVIVDQNRLEALVHRINGLGPDIVFFAGDTIDEDVSRFVEQKMPEALSKLNPKYGVYAVMGNHEYLGGNGQLAVEYLQQAGVHVLRDRYVKINEQFYVVGRDDLMAGRMSGKGRVSLPEIMQGVDQSAPVILLDHQPQNLAEGQQNGVDLQLSGHTHHGQFFPNSLVTERIYEVDWGYLRKGTYQAIVSCGYGTWGPPIRIGNYPEIVEILITFEGQQYK